MKLGKAQYQLLAALAVGTGILSMFVMVALNYYFGVSVEIAQFIGAIVAVLTFAVLYRWRASKLD